MKVKIVVAVLLVTLMTVCAGCNASLFRDTSPGPTASEPSIETASSYPIKIVAIQKKNGESVGPFFYKSEDGRVLKFETTGWWLKLSSIPTGIITSLAVDPTDSQIVYVVLYEGNHYKIVKTTDGGKTWTLCYNGYDEVGQGGVSLAICNQDHNILYMGGGGGAQKSMDGGKTWRLLDNGIATYGFLVWTIAIDPNNNSILFAGGEDQSAMLSATEGFIWEGGYWVEKNGTRKISPAELIPKYPHIPRLFYSENAGESWTELTFQLEGGGSRYLLGSDEHPFVIGNPLKVIFDPKNSQVVYLGTEGMGLLRSKNGGKTWEPLISGIVGHIAIDSEGTLYITSTCDAKTVLQSSDEGKTWRETEAI